MKKILIVVLSAIASLGVAFGASVVASADEVFITDLDDLKGATIVFNDSLVGNESFSGTLTLNYTSNNNSYTSITIGGEGKEWGFTYDSTQVYTVEDDWITAYQTIEVDNDTSISVSDATENETITFLNSAIKTFTPATPPAPAPTMWQAILSGIGGFLSGMFALISGAFTGVVSVFYANNTATIILQALIFAAAASLVAAAVYVIVRLIKSAVARLRGGVGAAGAKGDRNKKARRFFFRKRR